MKATELLTQQHDELRTMLEQLHEDGGNRRTPERLEAMARMLSAHMAIEEQLFYPAIRDANESEVLEGLEEHVLSKFSLKRVMETPVDDPTFGAKVEVLMELTKHHLDEEEEDLFPAAEEALGDESEALAERMQALFDATETQPWNAGPSRTGSSRTGRSGEKPASPRGALASAHE